LPPMNETPIIRNIPALISGSAIYINPTSGQCPLRRSSAPLSNILCSYLPALMCECPLRPLRCGRGAYIGSYFLPQAANTNRASEDLINLKQWIEVGSIRTFIDGETGNDALEPFEMDRLEEAGA